MGLSVPWKSAAHAWQGRGSTIPSISLGSPYQEQVRQYLLSTGPFPEHAAMVVEVSDENNRLIAVIGTPASSKWPTHYVHWIDICGIRFNLFVGPRMPHAIRRPRPAAVPIHDAPPAVPPLDVAQSRAPRARTGAGRGAGARLALRGVCRRPVPASAAPCPSPRPS